MDWGFNFIFNYVYVHSSPYLFVCSDDWVIYHPGADDVSSEPEDT